MTHSQLQARKAQLIDFIETEVYNEEQLAKFEAVAVSIDSKALRGGYPEDYPFAPSEEGLKRIVEEVLEEDRQGLFITDEELTEEMKRW